MVALFVQTIAQYFKKKYKQPLAISKNNSIFAD